MKPLICATILICILSSFSPRLLFKKDEPDVELAYRIREQLAQKLSKKYHMTTIGEVIAIPDHVLNLLGLRFQIQGPLTKDELRNILVDCVEELLCAVNSNKEIRPYLKNYPFTPQNIDIALFIDGLDGRDVSSPNIGIAAASGNKLFFYTKKPSEEYRYITEEETYEDALKSLGSKSNCLR